MIGYRKILAALLCVALAALLVRYCDSRVRYETYVVNRTTDESPHTVQLNRYLLGRRKYEPVLELRFPLTYYLYADNQQFRRQTKIGLSLDRRTFGPLNLSIARETGSNEPSSLMGGANAGRLEELLIILSSEAVSPARLPRSFYKPEEALGDYGPFALYKSPFFRPVPARCNNEIACRYGSEIYGVTRDDPAIHLRCGGFGLCTISFPFRNVEVDVLFNPKGAEDARSLRLRTIKLLEAHLVRPGQN